MLLSVLNFLHSLRWSLPAAIMLGSSPTFITMWGALRFLTLCLPRRFYASANDSLYSTYQRLVLFFFHSYCGTKVVVYGDTDALLNERKNVIFICNHQCTVDWIVTDMLASPQDCIGRIRYILKDGLRFFPLYGFYFRQHSCIYVKKTGKFNQQKAEKQLAELKTKDIPVWLVIFPEGTRLNPDLPNTVARSKQSAIEQGIEPFENVLTPRVKGLHLAVQQLQHHVDAIYDVTIAYTETVDSGDSRRLQAPGLVEFLMLKNPEIHVYFEKIPIHNVPKEDAELKQWLFTRFRHKDRLFSHFYSDKPEERGRFPGQSKTLSIPLSKTLPPFLFYSTCLIVLLSSPMGRSCYWKVGVFGSLFGCLWMCVRS